MNEQEWAWIAGLFEGEGHIGFGGRTGVSVKVGMTDQDVIETLHSLFPTSHTFRRDMAHRIKPLYMWSLSDRDGVRHFLMSVLPYLHSRRTARAEAALERLKNNRGARKNRTHCPRGHELAGDNVYVAATTGYRSCWTCRRARDKARDRNKTKGRKI